ncbi:MAG: FAD binding domain-containing protein [Armatimonadota bacterium]|nr:FAD binding domain-containing protein [Armatimonadota bacterium]MDR5696197.1 FAD binding domain-containing protein [Armatimonadota bacterium]
MKPPRFDYYDPHTLDEALALLAEHGDEGKILAGGQSLLPLLSMRLARPRVLIDINRLIELDYVRATDKEVRIGATARQRRIERSDAARRLPLLLDAIRWIGHPQIRNRGTVCGSLAHADPAAELPGVAAAVGATFVVRSAAGERLLQAEEFFVHYLTTGLRADEMLVEVRFPVFPNGWGWAFEEVSNRHGDYALCGVAAGVRVEEGRVVEARLAYVGVGPVPVRLVEAERAAACGEAVDEGARAAAAEAASRLEPDGDMHASAEFRRHLAGVLTRRALHRAHQRTASGDRAVQAPATPPDLAAGIGDRGVTLGERTQPPLELGGEPARRIRMRVNGVEHALTVPVRKTLADALREDLGLTGTHLGCEHGVCGACTVLLDGEAVRSCLLLAVQADGAELITVEGLGSPDRLHPLQQAFWEHHGLQCGFCTPGFLTTLVAFLRDNPAPTREQIREAISGNLCRCTGYVNIVDAVERAAALMRQGRSGS